MTEEPNNAHPLVLVTDYAWPDLSLERKILAEVGAELLEASSGEEAQLLELAPSVDGILTCWKPVGEGVVRRAKRCLCIGRFGIGLDNIAVTTATELGILVTNVPSYCVDEVSDHALALILACARKVTSYDAAIRRGHYDLSVGVPIFRLRGKVLGIVGFGNIGRAVCTKGRAFGLQVVVFDPFLASAEAEQMGAKTVTFGELLEQSDFISVHAPLTPDTENLFDRAAFQQMKKTAFLVNTSRGSIIDTAALHEALHDNLIAGAGLDVLPQEPPSLNDPVLTNPRIVVTPHAAFYSEESLIELRSTAARQMRDVLSGNKPQFVVNPQVLDRSNFRARLGP